ncbi:MULTISPECIES: hypothetical protein [Gordonia]|uniref:DUF8176 domain-containing protein n=1 Tax=Gordonia sihwensis NBRC 108236 TaxID=1223544 RepID=L7LQA1_9ACTN|nr:MULTISPECIES: hypothetical protein [Gordonia]WFN95163.1 hypothetical protein P5P27_20575 [Gordonia sihwensis]GAC62352.1 hypothetical protein GSI01S_33_00380 [Gordonia sihwensis NBRC 108236]
MSDNKLPTLPALPADDELPACALAADVRAVWGVAEIDSAEVSQWSWLTLLNPEVAETVELISNEHEQPEIPDMDRNASSVVVPTPRREPRRPRRQVVILSAFFTVLAVIVVGVSMSLASIGGDDSPAAEPGDGVSSAQESAAAAAPDPCPERVEGNTTYGDGVGDQRSGAGAIQAWNHAYYVTRSAREAKSVTAAGAVADEPKLQTAIDQVPAGTTHCLTMIDRGQGLYAVRLMVTPPGEQPYPIKQLVQTAPANGRWWIESIKKDEGLP